MEGRKDAVPVDKGIVKRKGSGFNLGRLEDQEVPKIGGTLQRLSKSI